MTSQETNDIIIRIFRIFLMITMSTQPLIIIINYFNYLYQEQTKEPINLTYLYLIDKIFILGALMLVLHITKKKRKIFIAFITNLIVAIAFFEYFSITRPKFIGYMVLLIILSFNKSLSLISEVKFSIFGISNVIIVLYVIIRTIIFKSQDPTFPLFYSIVLIIDYIITEIPLHYLFYNYCKFLTHKNNIIRDFKTIINLIPNPIIIYDTVLHSVTLSNTITLTKFAQPIMFEIISFAVQNPIPSIEIKFTSMEFSYSITTCHFETTSLENKSIIISIIDITDISRQERNAANEDAMWLFINAANHQIRTPLSGIESSLNMLQEAININDKIAIKSNINIAILSVLGLRHLIDDTLLLC